LMNGLDNLLVVPIAIETLVKSISFYMRLGDENSPDDDIITKNLRNILCEDFWQDEKIRRIKSAG
jgi:hypothetical protein